MITNDQAEGLVDTALLEELNLPVREIVGGCFCCRSETLVQALESLEEGEENAHPREAGRGAAGIRPNVFIAEPVGSCTDLV